MFSDVDQETVLAALLRGQGCANSLKSVLENSVIGSVSTESLINNILDSFSLALSLMNPPPYHESSSQNMAWRKICGVESKYRDDSPTPLLNDGFAWRKYGQKNIKASPHQRCYYKCTYAKDRNCNATKRVQKLKDNPPVYRTTYVGHHMCAAAVCSNNDETYGSKMIQFDKYEYDHVMSESVMPQLVSTDHQTITIQDETIDHIMNQECYGNEFVVDDDKVLESQFPPFSDEEYLMFFGSIPAFD